MVVVKKSKMTTFSTAHYELYCDDVAELDGYEPHFIIEAGSLAYTKTGDLAIYDGNEWNVVGG